MDCKQIIESITRSDIDMAAIEWEYGQRQRHYFSRWRLVRFAFFAGACWYKFQVEKSLYETNSQNA